MALKGKAGTAEEIKSTRPPMITQWFLHLPKQHPFWSDYLLAITSLADLPGLPAASKLYPQAENEIIFAALNPEFHPSIGEPKSLSVLHPVNYMHQFHGVNETQASAIARRIVQRFVDGQLLAEPQDGARDLFYKTFEQIQKEVTTHGD